MAITFNTTTGVFSSATSATVSGTASAGSLLLVYIYWGTGLSGQSITRSSGTTWTALDGTSGTNDSPGNGVEWCGYITNWAGGSFSTVFAEGGSSGKDGGWIVVECVGADTSASPLRFTPAASNFTSVHLMSNTDTGTTNTTDGLVGFFGYSNSGSPAMAADATANPTSGWTTTALQTGNSANTPHGHAWAMYQALSSAVTNPSAAANTGSSNVSGRCILVVVKAGSSGTAWSENLTDAHSGLDSRTSTAAKALADAHSALDSLVNTWGKNLADGTSGIDSPSKGLTVPFNDTQSATDTRGITVGKYAQDGTSGLDRFARTWTAHLSLQDAHSALDTLAKIPAKHFLDWGVWVDSVSVTKLSGTAWTRSLSDSHSALDVVTKLPAKWVQDNFSAIDLFARTWQAHLTLLDWASELDALAKQTNKTVIDNTSAKDAIIKGEGKTLGDGLSTTDQLGPKSVGKGLSDITSGTDSPAKSVARTLLDAFSATDQLTITRLLLLKLLDSVSLTDTISTNFQKAVVQGALAAVASSLAAVLQNQVAFGSSVLASTPAVAGAVLSNSPALTHSLLAQTATAVSGTLSNSSGHQ